MQSSNIPSKIPLPFAYAAGGSYKNTIPVASQIGITNGRASLTDGFPPLTFTPIGAGGVPPFGSDMNGILNEITAIQQWQEAGGYFPFDAAFAATIGGYPKGAILQSTSFYGLWVNTIENNSNNPDTTGTSWTPLCFNGSKTIAMTSSTVTANYLDAAYPILIITGTLTANSTLIVPYYANEWIIQNNTTGAYTLTVRTLTGTGATVTQGQSTYIYGDGSNVYFADSAKVASFNGRVGTVALNALDVTNALGYTPVNPASFFSSLTQNGYQYLPNGFIIQWGFVYTSAEGGYTATFPITFPNAVFNINATPEFNAPFYNGDWNTVVYQPTTTSYASFWQNAQPSWGGNPPYGFAWVAIGY